MLQNYTKVTKKLHDNVKQGLGFRHFATLQHYFRVFIYTSRESSTLIHIYI
ncbi:hypothetical protein VPHD148_0327 [Vibrio phage D148]